MIINCLCAHEGQDRIHGKGKRVANPLKDREKVRCTVCKTEVRVGNSSPESAPVKTKKK